MCEKEKFWIVPDKKYCEGCPFFVKKFNPTNPEEYGKYRCISPTMAGRVIKIYKNKNAHSSKRTICPGREKSLTYEGREMVSKKKKERMVISIDEDKEEIE